MTPDTIARAAGLLDSARRAAKPIETVPAELRPASFADSFAIQAALTKRRGDVAGWKISGGWPAAMAAMKLPHPVAAPIFADCTHGSPAKFERLQAAALVECEFAFLLGRDLPPRATPYTGAEVDAAIAAVMPGIELIDRRVLERDPMLLVADCISNGAYIRGANWTDWRALDLAAQAMSLRYGGETVARGTGNAIPGGPIAMMTVMANNQPPGSAGLRAGQFVTTGNCTGDHALGDAREVVADFGRLGEVRFTVS